MPQKVILLTDVPGLGQIGDQKTVKDGYARNYLLPRRLAVRATANEVNRVDRQRAKIEANREQLMGKAREMAEKIAKVGLVYERPMGQGGRLFGSVTPLDIASELSRQGATVEKRSILMDGPIKTPGDHTIRVRIHSKVVVDVPVTVKGIALQETRTTAETAPEMAPTPSDIFPEAEPAAEDADASVAEAEETAAPKE